MALSTQPYKGARDFYPEDKRIQDYMFGTIREAVKRYGYSEYDAPILESVELYRAKTGDEIVNEQTYVFTDRGGREVVIRPEMTPTVSRMVAARRQELAYPLRWFSIPNLWRYERPQRGRLREHWQLNVDIFGESGIAADHEIISVADSVLKGFGATSDMYTIKVNSRRLINELTGTYLNLDTQQSHDLTKLIDRMHKMDSEKFEEQLREIVGGSASKIMELLKTTSLDTLPAELVNHEAVVQLKQLVDLLSQTGITNVVFDITLMRGFDYYTDIVFEVDDTDPENNRSMFGGGRYDGLVGLFGVEPVPTAGFGMGDVTLANFLQSHNLMPNLETHIDCVILTIGDVYAGAANLAHELRMAGLSISIDATGRKLDKKLKAAEKQGLQYVLFLGSNELHEKVYMLKDLSSGEEQTIQHNDLAEIIRARHS